jgi:septal ring factor EnvC (AmiA/AmiB activator)
MSGQNGVNNAAHDEAERLEAALERIARAAAHAQHAAAAARQHTGLHTQVPHATTSPDTAEVAARIDALIADIRGVLGTQGN